MILLGAIVILILFLGAWIFWGHSKDKIEDQYQPPYDRTKATPEDDKARVEEWLLKKRKCPDCNSTEFYRGPQGGSSENYQCCHCGSKFNVGAPLFAERIN